MPERDAGAHGPEGNGGTDHHYGLVNLTTSIGLIPEEDWMGQGHAHGHARGGHSHGGHAHEGHAHGGRGANRKRLAITLALVSAYMVAEVIGGLVTNSLALLADAGHMLSDAGALALSLFAMWIAERPPAPKHSYGYYRTEILAALVNGATLVAISIFIFVEAWERFRDPPEIEGALMMWIATGGLVVNLLGLWLLNAGRDESLDVRGAWLHVLTDVLGSVGRSGGVGPDQRPRDLLVVEPAPGDGGRAHGERAGGDRRGRRARLDGRRAGGRVRARPARLVDHE